MNIIEAIAAEKEARAEAEAEEGFAPFDDMNEYYSWMSGKSFDVLVGDEESLNPDNAACDFIQRAVDFYIESLKAGE